MNREERDLTCIICPRGCAVTLYLEGGKVVEVTGNKCKRGEKYAVQETIAPMRTVTTTIRVTGGKIPVVSVKTSAEIPKDKIFECIRELGRIEVKAPVKAGRIILEDIAGTGISVVATKSVEEKYD